MYYKKFKFSHDNAAMQDSITSHTPSHDFKSKHSNMGTE